MAARAEFDHEVDECLEGLMHLSDTHDLVVMTLNLRNYSDFPRDASMGQQVLAQLTSVTPKPDVICVQDGLEGVDALSSVGYKRLCSSASLPAAAARSRLRDMVYGDADALARVAEAHHDRLLVNEIYVRAEGSSWEAADSGVGQISSDLTLMLDAGQDLGGLGVDCVPWPLAIRTAVWGKFRRRGRLTGPFVYVLCTRLTGCEFEDQFFFGQLSGERRSQVEVATRLLSGLAVGADDLGILVADLAGAVPEDSPWEPLGIRLAALMAAPGSQAKADVAKERLQPGDVERLFRAYVTGPLVALGSRGWHASACGKAGYVATNHATPMKVQDETSAGWRFAIWPRPGGGGLAKATFAVRAATAAKSPGSVAEPVGFGGRCAALRHEHRDLVREHRAEQDASEQLQQRLSAEMRELRDNCTEKGQAVGALTSRLAETTEVVTVELQSAAALRQELELELEREEVHRHELESTLGVEEAEAASKVQAAEQQLHAMQSVRVSLETQIRTSLQIQAELRDHIAAERIGRSELEVAGERELSAWRQQAQVKQQAESEEAEIAEKRTRREVEHLRQVSEQQCLEETAMMARLSALRTEQARDKARLQEMAEKWHYEVEVLRARAADVDEECRNGEEIAQELNEQRMACATEKEELEQEVQRHFERSQAGEADLEQVEHLSQQLREELDELRESTARCREDPEYLRLCRVRDEVSQEIHAEMQQKAALELELERASRSGFFRCVKRRQPPLPAPRENAPPSNSAAGGNRRTGPSGVGQSVEQGQGASQKQGQRQGGATDQRPGTTLRSTVPGGGADVARGTSAPPPPPPPSHSRAAASPPPESTGHGRDLELGGGSNSGCGGVCLDDGGFEKDAV
mmetsp:Transcript_81805/g.227814  ORF Transcript_81805/g.227814 Transcript_81805/m.227814 type:complete len:867 (-) Transcript_81805:239-2839(-)